MLALWTVLVPILITDVLNPILLGAVVFALGTERPYRSALLLLLGHTVAYAAAGVVLGLGLDAIEERLLHPEPVDFWIELVAAVLVLGVGIASALPPRRGRTKRFDDRAPLGPWAAFSLGAFVNLIGIPFAVPYFAAIAQILGADLATGPALAVLAAYNLLYALPFVLVVLARRVYQARAEALLASLSRGVERLSAVVMPLLLILLGAVLAVDAVGYLAFDRPLFPAGP